MQPWRACTEAAAPRAKMATAPRSHPPIAPSILRTPRAATTRPPSCPRVRARMHARTPRLPLPPIPPHQPRARTAFAASLLAPALAHLSRGWTESCLFSWCRGRRPRG
eukprot:2528957-Pyramimonas_sp.AAC.2